LLVQAFVLGSAMILLADRRGLPTAIAIFVVSSLIHLLMIWGEVSVTHPTAHARLAIYEMVHGRFCRSSADWFHSPRLTWQVTRWLFSAPGWVCSG
jgi:hypothetical protein